MVKYVTMSILPKGSLTQSVDSAVDYVNAEIGFFLFFCSRTQPSAAESALE